STRQGGGAGHVLPRYERVCFDKPKLRVAGKPPAELIAPGHPLLDAVVRTVQRRYGSRLAQGAGPGRDNDAGTRPTAPGYRGPATADRTAAAGRGSCRARSSSLSSAPAASTGLQDPRRTWTTGPLQLKNKCSWRGCLRARG